MLLGDLSGYSVLFGNGGSGDGQLSHDSGELVGWLVPFLVIEGPSPIWKAIT